MINNAYFNNASTTFPKPKCVYDFMDKYYRDFGKNIGRGYNSNNIIEETRGLLLDLFTCKNKNVVFTHTATEAINIILQGITISENSNVYISPFEHNAVIRTLNFLQDTYNINIHTLDVDYETMTYNMENIEQDFRENTPNIMVISHASNVCGLVSPIEGLCTLSKKYKSINIIDMCQSAGVVPMDLSSNIYDFAIFAGHKTLYAPFGVAGFICNYDIELKPLIYGGTGIDSANPTVPKTMPERFEVGSLNILAIAGLNASLKWIKNTGITTINEIEKKNRANILNLLMEYDNINIIGNSTQNEYVGIVSCIFDSLSSDSIGKILYDFGIEVRTGLHCSPNAHKFLQTFPQGTVRFSLGYFNTDDEIELLKKALDYIYENS